MLLQRQSGLCHHCIGSDICKHGCHFRQPEVQNLGVPTVSDKDVGRLDVAVNDPLGVRGVERIGDLDSER